MSSQQRNVADWEVEEVVLFFVQNRLQNYLSIVRTNAINGKKLLSLDDSALADLGISKADDRQRLLEELRKRRRHASFTYSEVQATRAAQDAQAVKADDIVMKLRGMFPDIAEPSIRYILSSNNNNEAAALDTLLALQALGREPSSHSDDDDGNDGHQDQHRHRAGGGDVFRQQQPARETVRRHSPQRTRVHSSDHGGSTAGEGDVSRYGSHVEGATLQLQGVSLGESSSDSPRRHGTMRRGERHVSSSALLSSSDVDPAVVDHMCGLFPELEPELIVHALELNDEDQHVRRLSKLFPELSSDAMLHTLRSTDNDVQRTVKLLSEQDSRPITVVRPAPQRAASISDELARPSPRTHAADARKRPTSDYSGLRRHSLRRASLMLRETAKEILLHNRWQDRPDVKSAGLLQSLPKQEIKRQEAIWEIAVSEEAYLKDVHTLQELVLKPMQELFRRSRKPQRDPTTSNLNLRSTSAMLRTVEKLHSQGSAFLSQLRMKQATMMQVDSISDVILDNIADTLRVFAGYCSVCFRLQRVNEMNHKELKALFEQAAKHPMARCLPIDAFILAPIQRLARYPLLVQAVLAHTPADHPEHGQLEEAHQQLTECVQACNARLRSLEDFALLEKLDQQMDYNRLQHHTTLVQRNRALLRRGTVKFLRLQKGKIAKSKSVECFLFTDLLMYAKPVRAKKKVTYIVYKQVHRSLVDAKPAEECGDLFPGVVTLSSSDKECMFVLVLYGQQPLTLLAKAPSPTDRQRWLEVLNPPKESNEYAEWNCPRARVIRDYDAKQKDELTLRVGDVLNIIVRNQDGFSKGAIVSTVTQTNRQTRGWFPVTHVKEIVSQHSEAKVFKANFNAKAARSSLPK
ncbi:hypothetical protein PTSG_06171 [Salpingoeca rosetta]|uniref:Uncharacterized protein n=1 Tax=Salpingoeca rosetta (strain ATCC 50818 / BSB-021) TaxID=946362 RepID=F2UC56_SALR5|nr:uncharacterized protein PTSG_06171 [Salpingoeca rosetta]EGD74163.1 hypothetical protein PTSG_06171 [Salpingoeca rosetta]|eukprot:XP_004993063.1 hypothetical protein PTSG_06171 [Salpingoeca rosetta]